MSDQENFLSRWSRRKRDTANENAQPDKPAATGPDKPAEPGPDATPAVAGTTPAAASAPEFDLTKLPSLDSIGANTDIRDFLQPGVPPALKHAALRRAWSADPAIRDYIGPAEYAWDFTDPKAMPGFGESRSGRRRQEARRRGFPRHGAGRRIAGGYARSRAVFGAAGATVG